MSNILAESFFNESYARLQGETTFASERLQGSITPYESLADFAFSWYVPFIPLIGCVENLSKITQGSILLINALFDQPWNAIPHVLASICMDVAGLALNACMIAVACLSWLTRSIASFVSLGFESNDNSDAGAGSKEPPLHYPR